MADGFCTSLEQARAGGRVLYFDGACVHCRAAAAAVSQEESVWLINVRELSLASPLGARMHALLHAERIAATATAAPVRRGPQWPLSAVAGNCLGAEE